MSGPCAKIASIERGIWGACAATECAASANAATAGNRKTDFRVKAPSPGMVIRPGTKELSERAGGSGRLSVNQSVLIANATHFRRQLTPKINGCSTQAGPRTFWRFPREENACRQRTI